MASKKALPSKMANTHSPGFTPYAPTFSMTSSEIS